MSLPVGNLLLGLSSAGADTDLHSAGGPKAWREMQQRQMEFYQGFDQDAPAKSKDPDEDDDPEFSQDVQAHLEGMDEAERKPEEDDETVSFGSDIPPRRHC